MLQEMVRVAHKGDESGNNMVIVLRLPSGLEIAGLATKNLYGGEWDYGPSWNYVICGDRPSLVDTGRFGMGGMLLKMMEAAGVSGKDLGSVIISHGHEDHDGGLYEIVRSTGAKVKAHSIYDRLIRFYPGKSPPGAKKNFPSSCWHCFLPESFSSQYCLAYQHERSTLEIQELRDGDGSIGETVNIHHVPGHSPDALAIQLGGEVLFVGDTVLPDITPFPTREEFFYQLNGILEPHYSTAQSIYGLRAYIRSLKKLKEIGKRSPGMLILPAHRLFYNNQWNGIELLKRLNELIQHHIDRCADILRILGKGPKTSREIVLEHFEEPQLKGVGIYLAENEILSHLELLGLCEDVRSIDETRFVATGASNFASTIHSLEPGQ
jgi:glyoxylase-like metal-dependent hydrolase (beta-lactamase superfamily II)